MNYETVQARVEAINKVRDATIELLAVEVRDKLVVPLCRKYKLTYSAGNADFWFEGVRRGVPVRWSDPLDDDVPEYVKEVLRVLDVEVEYAQHLGYYVAPVR